MYNKEAMAKYDSLRKLKRNKALKRYRRLHPDASLEEIGRMFSISKQRVHELLNQLGGIK
jgi:predicted DNA-binding protein YlxM (UPF0122 family)